MVKVLLVEDEPLIAMNLTLLVESMGHEVVGPAASSAQALALAEAAAPAVALVDLNLLDGSTGLVLAERLARNWGTAVVIVTANPEGVEEGESGVLDVIQKPYRDETIVELLRRVLAQCWAAPWDAREHPIMPGR